MRILGTYNDLGEKFRVWPLSHPPTLGGGGKLDTSKNPDGHSLAVGAGWGGSVEV